MAISAIDCAMWDLKGRVAGLPVHRLLGGPTRPSVPAYASMLGYSLQPDLVAKRAREFAAAGYTAMKWFYRDGTGSGRAGMDRNEELVATVRDAVGPDVDIMTDAWMSWDVPYTLAMARRLEQYRPRWIEEPVLPDRVQSYAEIRRASPIPIAGGEHEFTAAAFAELIERRLHHIVQPDVCWVGGMTELVKIYRNAQAHGVRVCPHRGAEVWALHALAALDSQPLAESGRPWMTWVGGQPAIVNGAIAAPTGPGFGTIIDEGVFDQ